MRKRLIPVLLLSEDGLIKTKKFKGDSYIGDIINTVKLFNDMEVDEIIVLDIYASRKAREPQFTLIEEVASEAFMPLCYGGGITSVEQARRLFYLGIEKISFNNLLFRNPQLVLEIAERFGSQSIVASLDISKDIFGRYRLFDYKRKKRLKIDFLQKVQEIEQIGAGEILLNFVDRDGMMSGIEEPLLKKIYEVATVPIIYCGGVGHLDHIDAAFKIGSSAVAAGSFFVYRGKGQGVLINYPNQNFR